MRVDFQTDFVGEAGKESERLESLLLLLWWW